MKRVAPFLRFGVVALAAYFSAATSAAPRTPRNYPSWRVDSGGTFATACAQIRGWISKSGKEGVGVTLSARARGAGRCAIHVVSARIVVADVAAPLATPPPVLHAAGDAPEHAYLGFVFDNEQLWNEEKLEGTLELDVRAGDAAASTTHRMALAHVWTGPHRERPRGQP